MFGQLGFAQTLGSYAIISFEDSYKISEHGTKRYHWIIETDSLESYNIEPSYLFLNFSKENLEDCCDGIEVDPFLVFPSSKYEIDSIHSLDLEKLENIISQKRKKIMEVKKRWSSGQWEVVKVYVTPVIGKFCSSNFHEVGQQRQGYKGKVYMPFSSFEYQADFWESEKAKFILNSDMSRLKFNAITY
jgi:hypothetical protein